MPVTRERVDPIRDPSAVGPVHRRWILPDDVQRPIQLAQLARLWRGLIELSLLDSREEARLERFGREAADLPAPASPGALPAGSGAASPFSQVLLTHLADPRAPS